MATKADIYSTGIQGLVYPLSISMHHLYSRKSAERQAPTRACMLAHDSGHDAMPRFVSTPQAPTFLHSFDNLTFHSSIRTRGKYCIQGTVL